MRTKWRIVLVRAVTFAGGVAAARAFPARSPETAAPIKIERPMLNVRPILDGFNSGDSLDPDLASQELIRLHGEITTELVKLARSQDKPRLAVPLLAKFYSPDAISLLVERVDYDQAGWVTEVSPLNGYPCAQALQRFGQMSTAAIFEYLWNAPSEDITDKANELYALLFIGVYGPPIRLGGAITGGPDEAIGVIERARDRFQGRGKENCQRLLDKVKHLVAERYKGKRDSD